MLVNNVIITMNNQKHDVKKWHRVFLIIHFRHSQENIMELKL